MHTSFILVCPMGIPITNNRTEKCYPFSQNVCSPKIFVPIIKGKLRSMYIATQIHVVTSNLLKCSIYSSYYADVACNCPLRTTFYYVFMLVVCKAYKPETSTVILHVHPPPPPKRISFNYRGKGRCAAKAFQKTPMLSVYGSVRFN
jgi:hypothetical protein